MSHLSPLYSPLISVRIEEIFGDVLGWLRRVVRHSVAITTDDVADFPLYSA